MNNIEELAIEISELVEKYNLNLTGETQIFNGKEYECLSNGMFIRYSLVWVLSYLSRNKRLLSVV